jgi:hypothetical protein
MKQSLRVMAALAAFVLVAVGWVPPASAHGQRRVGEIELTFGWAEEPAFIGFKNAVQLFLARPDEEPIEGAEKTLEVEVSLGEAKTERLALRTVFESPGEYQADLIPTAPGGYTFRFVGEVDGEAIDESVTAPEDGFDEVQGTSEVAFPNAAPSTTELAERLEGVEATANDAQDDLTLPRILSVVGIVLGLAALIVAFRPRGARG